MHQVPFVFILVGRFCRIYFYGLMFKAGLEYLYSICADMFPAADGVLTYKQQQSQTCGNWLIFENVGEMCLVQMKEKWFCSCR